MTGACLPKRLKGRRLYAFKVFTEYPLHLGSGCVSMFSENLTFGKTLMMQFCNFFLQNRHFLAINIYLFKRQLEYFSLSSCLQKPAERWCTLLAENMNVPSGIHCET